MNTPLQYLTEVLLLTAFLLVGTLFFARAKHYLHMLQLDSYANARLVRWIAARPTSRLLDLPRQALLGLCSLALLTVAATFSSAPAVLLVAAVCLIVVASVRLSRDRHQEPPKKPLVMTGRATRILAATLAVGLVLSSLASYALIQVGLTPLLTALYVTLGIAALLPMMAATSTLCGNILLIPLQAGINRGFVARAQANLKRVSPTVVGITGSFGKTTTKYFLDALIRDSMATVKTPQSFNTLLGVCRVINEVLKPGTKLFIAEMGAYRPGDIGELAQLLTPTIGVLTAIGPQHLERFGSIEAVERTKFELIQSLPPDGLAVLNFDDARCRRLATQTGVTVMAYGTDLSRGDLTVWAENVRMTPNGMTFEIGTQQWGRTTIQTPVLGSHNVLNILAATCVALYLGVPLDTLRRRMKTLEGAPHRLQFIKGNDGVIIIDDSYNANPIGAAEALHVLGQFHSGKRILITPGMVELGSDQEIENQRFGELAATVCDYIFLVAGASSEAIHKGLIDKDFPEGRIRTVSDLTGARTELTKLVQAGDVVLFANDLPDLYEAKS